MVTEPQQFYLGIGAPRSGTTWLYKNIRASTDLYMPPVKELRFFRGPRSLRERTTQINTLLNTPRLSAADQQFVDTWRKTKDGDGAAYPGLFPTTGKIGEISPIYSIMNRKEIVNLRQYLDGFDVRAFYMLRNPFFRDRSHVVFSMHRQKNRTNPHSESAYKAFIETESFKRRSDYNRNINNWRAVLRSDLNLFYYDELAAAPKRFFIRFCKRLDITCNRESLTRLGRNKSGSDGRFAVTLPPAIEDILRQRAEDGICNNQLIASQYQSKWLEELALYFQNRPPS